MRHIFWKRFAILSMLPLFVGLLFLTAFPNDKISNIVHAYDIAWPYRVAIEIPPGIAGEDFTDFPVQFDMSQLPASFFTNVATDGGDIRVTESDGSTELPREVVFVSTTAGTGELYFKGDITSAATSTFYIYYGNGSATEPAADATYGKWAVWSDYNVVHHFQALVKGIYPDSAGNGINATPSDFTFVSEASGFISGGKSMYISKEGHYVSFPSMAISALFPTTFHISYYASVPSTSDLLTFGFLGNSTADVSLNPVFLYPSDFYVAKGGGSFGAAGSFTAADTNWNSYGMTNDNATYAIYQNGSQLNVKALLQPAGTDQSFAIGVTGLSDDSNPYLGYVDEFRIRTSTVSKNWAGFEHFMATKQFTTWSVGAEESVGGAATYGVWDGDAADGDWCTASNWSEDTLPTSTTDVVIDLGQTVDTSGCGSDAVEFGTLTLGETMANKLYFFPDAMGTAGDVTVKGNGLLYQFGSSTITFSGDVVIENGGKFYSGENTTSHQYSVNISATNIDIQSGASVDVDQLGFDGGTYPSNGSGPVGGVGLYGGSQKSGGGGAHCGSGGNGTSDSVKGGVGYADITNPVTIGAGGGPGYTGGRYGGAGGGLIRLAASGTITVDGTLTADGEDGQNAGNYGNGGGAGGAIFLDAAIITGTPQSFTTIGGIGTDLSSKEAGGGGGGCITINYTTSNSITTSSVAIYGGSGNLDGGSGVLYLKQDAQNGYLYTINNGGAAAYTAINDDITFAEIHANNYASPLLSATINTGVLSLLTNSTVTIDSGSTTTLTNTKEFSGDGTGTLVVNGYFGKTISELFDYNLEIGNGGVVSSTALAVGDGINFSVYDGASISDGGISTLTSSGTLYFESGVNINFGDVTMTTGSLMMSGFTTSSALEVTSFTMNGGSITHPDNSSAQTHIINISSSGDITINTNASIDVDGLGYDGGAYSTANRDGYGPTGGFGKYGGSSTNGGGGAHCGDGGAPSSNGGVAYGNISNVSTMGAGGGAPYVTNAVAGDGGGLIILAASNTLYIDGSLSANGTDGDGFGAYDGGGGAGGGIRITAGTLSGTPSVIEAIGGTGVVTGGGGGGGCIQATYSTKTMNTSTLSVAGGTGGDNGEVGEVSFVQLNEIPTATMGNPSQTAAGIVTATSTVADADSDVTSLIVEHSTDGTTWASSTLGVITETEGGDGVTTSTGNIADIDTDNDGSVTITSIQWNIEADLPNTDDSTVYLRFIPYDGIGYGNIVSSTAFAIDTADPAVPGNLAVGTLASSTINFTFPSASSDTNFSEYKIFYDTNSSVNEADTAFTSTSDANLGAVNFNAAGTSENITGLTPNTTYYFNLFTYDTWGNVTSSASELSTTTLANVPEGVTFVSFATSSVTVIWSTSDNNPAGTVYEVYNVTDSTSVGTTTSDNLPVTGLTPGTLYAFKVRAQNSAGVYTSYTSNSEMVTFPVAGSTPTTSNVSTSSLDLTFTAGDNGATTTFALYNVTEGTYISASGASTSSAVYQSTSTWGGTVSLTGLTPGTSYTFQNIAFVTDNTATSTASTGVYTLAVVAGTPTVVASTTTALTISFGAEANAAATTYALYNSTDGNYLAANGSSNGATPIYQTTSTWGTLYATGLNINSAYQFTAIARNGDSVQAATSSASTAVYTFAAAPGTPTFSSIATSSMTISWSANSNPGTTEYELRLSDDTLITTTTATSYSHTGLDTNTSYTYKVRAKNGDDVYTSYSSTASQSTSSDIPTAPSAHTTSTIDTISITFTWTDNSSNETSFLYDYITGSDTNDFAGTTSSLAANTTSTEITSLTPNTQYTARVAAVNGDGTSSYATTTGSIYTNAAVPGTPSATATGQTTMTVSWSANSNAAGTVYELSNETLTAVIATTTDTSYAVTGLTAATSYQFSVRAQYLSDNSTYTAPSSASTAVSTSAADSEESEESSSGSIPIAPPPLILEVIDGKDVAFEINSGESETNNKSVTLSVNAANISHMAISNSLDFTGISFVPFTSSYSHILNAGNGIKTVYARLRSAQGGTLTVSDTISLIGQLFEAEIETSTELVDCTLTTDKAYSVPGEAGIYYVTTQCTKRPFRRSYTYFTYFTSWEAVIDTTQNTLDSIPDDSLGFMPLGPLYNPASGALIKLPNDPKVYLLLGETIYHIANEAAAEFQFGPQWNTWIDTVDPRVEESYIMSDIVLDNTTRPDGILIKYTDSNKVYKLQTTNSVQEKRWITDEATFNSLRFRWDRIVTIPDSEVYEDGQDL